MSLGTDLEAVANTVATSDLVELYNETEEHAKNARSERTTHAYQSDWRVFTEWCDSHGATALPADPNVVAMFLSDQARRLSPATLRRRLVSISVNHQEAEHDTPTTTAQVRNVMKGITRQAALTAKDDGRRTLQRHATAVDLPKLAQIIGQIPDTTTIGLRDRALLLVGFAGGFRRSELVGLTVEALDFTDAGIRAHLTVSKTDQTGEGTARLIRRGSTALDPVNALNAWTEHADIESGPIFRSVDRHGNIATSAMSDRAVAQIMKARATAAGIDSSTISGHSLRRGAATTARRNGADPISIARGLGWADGSTVLNRYFETSIEDAPNLGL